MRQASIIRATIANVSPEELAPMLQARKLSGTLFASLGFGDWGVEKGTTVEIATRSVNLTLWELANILSMRNEECAYVTIASQQVPQTPPSLLYWHLSGAGDISFTLEAL